MNPEESLSVTIAKSFQNGLYRGITSERERIIKLLEAECCELTDCRCEMRIKWAIALIKGETN